MEKLKRRIPEAGDELLYDLLAEAEAFLLSYTGHKSLPQGLESARVRIAAARYHGLGLEAEASHSEGGVSMAMDRLPEDLKQEIGRYRLAKAGW